MLPGVENLRRDLPQWACEPYDSEWRNVLEHLRGLGEGEDHPCAMSLDTRRMLYQTTRAMGAKTILDIGTFTGSSALVFAFTGADVVTVDLKDANALDGHWATYDRPASPHVLMSVAEVQGRVEFVTQDSVEYLQKTYRKFDFICIDGWHEAHQVAKEIPLAIARLNPNGLIFMDDVQTQPPPPGVDRIDGPREALECVLAANPELAAVHLTPWTAFVVRQ